MLSDLDQHQLALADCMSSLSEGWMDGLEFEPWRAAVEGPCRYGRLELTAEHIARLRRTLRRSLLRVALLVQSGQRSSRRMPPS